MQADQSMVVRMGAIVAGTLAIAMAHHVLLTDQPFWLAVSRYLYFLPLVLSCLWFGWRGGLAGAALVTISYAPDLGTRAASRSPGEYGELFDFLVVGLIAGLLAEREIEQRRRLRLTSAALDRSNRELQESFERLKQAERLSAIGQLAANLAHEIRNPLASIEGAADVLRPRETPEELRQEFLGIIKKECRRLSRLLTNMLDYARPKPPALQDVPVEALLDGVAELGRLAAGKAAITIRKELPAHLPHLRCDPEQMKQVLLNLIVNAIQAMPEGGQITLRAHPEQSQLAIQVQDEGVGIQAEQAEMLFSPFYTTKANGTGLGLSVAQQIVAQHSGSVTAAVAPGKGAVFTVRLPVARGE